MERIEHHASFDGWQDVYQHESTTLGCTMKVGVYLPPQAQHGKVPVLYWLSGLTCTEQLHHQVRRPALRSRTWHCRRRAR